MSFFKLCRPPGNTWPPLPDTSVSQLWAAYLQLDRTQWLTPAEIEAHQLDQVRTLLDHCAAHVPYYRQLLAEADLQPRQIQSLADFRRIPLLTRRTCQDRNADLCAEKLPPGCMIIAEGYTSGTSGLPLKVLGTNGYRFWGLALHLRHLEWSGTDPTGTVASVRRTGATGVELQRMLEGATLPYWNWLLVPLIEMGTAHRMDIQQDPRRQLQWLRRVDPDYLSSNTGNLEALAGLVQESGQRLPRLRHIHSAFEAVTDEARARIEGAFGVPLKDAYSCTEAGYVASSCPAGHGLHVYAENVLLEVLDEAGRPCAAGQTGRVVLTTLHNYCFPLIRYDIGDDVTLGPGPCPCGRGLPWLVRIDGKRRPMFQLAGGRLKSTAPLGALLDLLGGHYQRQVVQTALDRVVVRLVPSKDWSAAHAERLRGLLHDFFEGPLAVDIELTERLELPPSGKLQSMICAIRRGS
jgi:phenylacetate-CoA ligase